MESLITVVRPHNKTKELFITIFAGKWVVVWHEYADNILIHKTIVGSYYTIIDAAGKFHEEKDANGGKHLITEY